MTPLHLLTLYLVLSFPLEAVRVAVLVFVARALLIVVFSDYLRDQSKSIADRFAWFLVHLSIQYLHSWEESSSLVEKIKFWLGTDQLKKWIVLHLIISYEKVFDSSKKEFWCWFILHFILVLEILFLLGNWPPPFN